MEWDSNLLHTEESPKGVSIEMKGNTFTKKELIAYISSDNFKVIKLKHNNACLVYDDKDEGFLNITCTMMLMAFTDDKQQKMIYGNCLLTNINNVKSIL